MGGDRDAAGQVLNSLINARLLTSYEVPPAENEDTGSHRIEIIHESLLSNWPRLVRWQSQDTDSALLRDELRQAAQTWGQHNRSEDLLWTGTAFKEFQLWRERYPGGLTATEEAFAQAMTTHATRRKRRRRIAVVAAFLLLLAVLGVFGKLWRQSELSERQARDEARRRETAQLLALGRLQLADHPSAALAYALASLDRADSQEARVFALEALWRGPPAFILEGLYNIVRFSPNGQWLAGGSIVDGVRLWPHQGDPPVEVIGTQVPGMPSFRFDPLSDLLFVEATDLHTWSIPEQRELRRTELPDRTGVIGVDNALTTYTRVGEDDLVFRSWPLAGGEPSELARWNTEGVSDWDIDPSSEWIAFARGTGVYLKRMEALESPRARLVGQHGASVTWISFSPEGDRIIAADEAGEIHLWSLSGSSDNPERTFHMMEPINSPWVSLDRDESRLVAASWGPHSTSEVAFVWDLTAPPDADPLVLRNSEMSWLNTLSAHPQGSWVATGHGGPGLLWPLGQSRAHIIRGQSPPFIEIDFTPDGRWLASTSDEGVLRLWPMSPSVSEVHRVLLEDSTALIGFSLSVDSTGTYALTISRFDDRVFLTPLDGGETRLISGLTPETKGFDSLLRSAFSPDGRLMAIEAHPGFIRIVDVHTGAVRSLDSRIGDQHCGVDELEEGYIFGLAFTPDGHLISSLSSGIFIWDLEFETPALIRPCVEGFEPMIHGRTAVKEVLVHEGVREDERYRGVVSVVDLATGNSRAIASHGNSVTYAEMNTSGEIVVTGDSEGVVRVGSIAGEEPHLLLGHRLDISGLAVSPDDRWVASASQDGTIRLWPMPDLTKPPFHTLPYDELLANLRSLTNLRVVEDEKSATGYKLEPGPFPGWEEVPVW